MTSPAEDLPEADARPPAPHPRHTVELFGQEAAEAEFAAAWTGGHRHHAWLITGRQGIGKATLAWKIARYLRTRDAGERDGAHGSEPGLFGAAPGTGGAASAEPSGRLAIPAGHPVLSRLEALADPGLALIRRPWDDKAKRLRAEIGVDDIRRLTRFLGLSAADGGTRVVIIDAADEMNRNAANALLKMLEEPPDNTVLLLVAHQPSRLLPTIRSRCRVLRCQPLSAEDLSRALVAAGLDPQGRETALAELAAGSVGAAVGLLAGDGIALYERLVALIARAPGLDRARAAALADSCAGPANATAFEDAISLTRMLLCRLARNGAGAPPVQEAAPGEAAVLARLSPDPARARLWAEAAATLPARAERGRAVNLDAAGIILDMWLRIDRTAEAALGRAIA